MKNKRKIFIDGGIYWISEFTVGDVFALYYNLGHVEIGDKEEWLTSLLANRFLLTSITTCPWDKIVGLGASELQSFYNIFLELNDQFFRNIKPNANTESTSSEIFIDRLFELCCNLIEVGHAGVFNYGYSFFIKSVNNHEKIKSRNIAEMATGMRMAQHGDAKEWKNYVRSLVG
jgi:hypothetical protein